MACEPNVDYGPILRVVGLKTYFHLRDGTLQAVDDVSFEVGTGKTLCIVGDEDPALEDVKFVHSQIEGSELVVVPNAGHFANLDQTEVFNREILAFLAKVDARRAAAVT